MVRILFSCLCSSLFCKRFVFIYLRISFCHLRLGVLGPWEFLWRAGSYIFCVCVTLLCGVPGRYKFYSGTLLELMAGLYRLFPFLWLCCSGYGTVEMVRGVFCLSFRFLQFAVSSLGGWMSVVGFCFSAISIFFDKYVVVFFSIFLDFLSC